MTPLANLAILTLPLAVGLMGCEGSGKAATPASSRVRPPRLVETARSTPPRTNLDFGQDWADVESLISGGARHRPPDSSRDDDISIPGMGYGAPPRFGICLASFSGGSHRANSNEYLRRISLLVPDMADDLTLHIESTNSLVLFGDYEGWKDPQARKDMARLSDMELQGRRLFSGAIMTEVQPPRDPATISPRELLSVRLRNPDIRTLYTLEVAVWGDFDSGRLDDGKRRRLAEEYAASLRRGGHQSWFHHDEGKKMSTVTVGVFDHRAIDAASGIRSAAVERVAAAFPTRLVNGEPLMIPVSRNDPGAGTKAQKPPLVEVPPLNVLR